MGTIQQNSILARFFYGLFKKFADKEVERARQKESKNTGPQPSGYHRSSGYIPPALFYRHGSGTFKKNQRKGL